MAEIEKLKHVKRGLSHESHVSIIQLLSDGRNPHWYTLEAFPNDVYLYELLGSAARRKTPIPSHLIYHFFLQLHSAISILLGKCKVSLPFLNETDIMLRFPGKGHEWLPDAVIVNFADGCMQNSTCMQFKTISNFREIMLKCMRAGRVCNPSQDQPPPDQGKKEHDPAWLRLLGVLKSENEGLDGFTNIVGILQDARSDGLRDPIACVKRVDLLIGVNYTGFGQFQMVRGVSQAISIL